MKIFLLVGYFLGVPSATLVDPSVMNWQEFKEKFGKTYETRKEEQFRQKIFMEKRTLIIEHNAKYDRGEVTYKRGINKFSDLTQDEFLNFYTGLKYPKTEIRTTINFPDDMSVPGEVNWVDRGAVTPIKNQGFCGSCYAFSATGSMEGQHFIKKGKLVSLSEQNIIDCSNNFGCSGGTMERAFKYVIENKGIDTEASYPYEADQGCCRFNKSTIGATFSNFTKLPTDDESALEKAVATVGPISIAVDATDFTWYKSGIFKEQNCSAQYLNHGMLAVGYGIDNITEERYWLVKNSWGENWGEKGYIRIAKDAGNMCGVATAPLYPVV